MKRALRVVGVGFVITSWDSRLSSASDNSFDAIRLVLASLVVFEHSYFLPFNSRADEPLYLFSRGQIDFGSMAVDFFFLLSGFLITRSWQLNKSPWRYLQKRAARIVPGFLAVSVLTFAVAAYYSIAPFKFSNIVNILSLRPAGLQGFPDNPMSGIIDGTLWTIRYEVDCYLLVAALGLLGILTRVTSAVLFLCFALTYLLQSAGYLHMPVVDHGISALLISNPERWPRLFTYFWAGAAFYLWRESIPKSPALAALAAIILILALRFGCAEAALMLAGTYLMFWVALSSEAVPRIFCHRVDLSYGIYLYGFPIQQGIIATWPSISPPYLFVTSMLATVCVAYLSWVLIESPSIRFAWSPLRRRAL